MSKPTTTRKADYFRLPRPPWRKLKKCLPNKSKDTSRRGGRPGASDRAVINGIWYVLWTGRQWKAVHRDWFGVCASVIHERFQSWTRMGIFGKLMKRMAEYYAGERGGVGWRWQAMDSESCAAPLGGEETGKNPTDGGKLGAKINLLVDERGAPISIALTGANRRDKVSAIDPIASIILKRPVGRSRRRRRHMCADKAYDARDVREFVASEGYAAHIKVNPRRSKKSAQQSGEERPPDNDSSNSKVHPARRWVVERTISWLSKRRGLRTRWAKKAENWLSFVQLACAHILLNLAVFG